MLTVYLICRHQKQYHYFRKAGKKLKQTEWILCPVCGSKTRSRIREDTILINYPLYCPKCRQERLIEVRNLQTIVITEPDTLDAEPMNV